MQGDLSTSLRPAQLRQPRGLGPHPGCCVPGSGISSYASNPARVGESLQGCLEEALALIPKAKHHETPMFLGATAGMRLLR